MKFVKGHVPANKRHGLHATPEYVIYRSMVGRCHRPSCTGYKDYGARGITVCAEWRESFENFFRHMGERPTPTHSLSRKDNDGNYEPGNVVWATREEQENNKRTSRFLILNGERKTLAQWARLHGITRQRLWTRLGAQGLSLEEALRRPIRKKRRGGNPLLEW